MAGAGLAAAADRHVLIAGMMDADPGGVLRVALPARLRATLPPDVLALVEEHGEI
ncbi:MAG TPA: hypothetical protein VGB42_05620 [Candidatus Thermoplasmatota archaeon]